MIPACNSSRLQETFIKFIFGIAVVLMSGAVVMRVVSFERPVLVGTGLFFFECVGDHRDLHSFPTRRSSDLPYSQNLAELEVGDGDRMPRASYRRILDPGDRKSTRLNSSHVKISYDVFCL